MKLIPYDNRHQDQMVTMITGLFNHHRDLTQSRAEFYQTQEESKATLGDWLSQGEVLLIEDQNIIGFFYVRYGGQRAAWLEDLFIEEAYRGRGYGKGAMKLLDDHMKAQNILAMFVDVIPRNVTALQMYVDCGFDHLNMIQLRKNYDPSLNKLETLEILGHQLKKY